MLIRTIQPDEFIEYAYLIQCLEAETDYLKYGAYERNCTPKRAERRVTSLLNEPNSTIFVVENEGDLVGHLTVFGKMAPRAKHCATIVMGILQEHWGEGLGYELLKQTELWARERQLTRLEAMVMTHNQRAVALFQKAGFKAEGVRQYSLFINGNYVDEYYMAKVLQY